jgi:diguanylate cyclase (GGDEF)-like protein
MAVGAVALFGWSLHIPAFLTLAPGLASMKANTAAGFIALGAGLLLPDYSLPRAGLSSLGRALAVLALALGCATIAEYIFGVDLGLDQIILRDWASSGTAVPGRMAPMTAVVFVLLAAAVIAVKASEPRVAQWANWLAGSTLFFSTLAIVGYTYGVSSLYKLEPFSSMALHTALGFFLLSLAVYAANPAGGVGSLVSSGSAGGVMTRRLLSTVPLATFLLGALCVAGLQAKLYDGRFGLSLMVVMSLTVTVAAILSTGMTLRRVDVTRERAEADLVELSASLDRRIEERTGQLAGLTRELAEANDALKQLSLHDPLTGLANRRFFDGYLAAQMALARRNGQALALVLCDIDGFKDYNDRHGHPGGDEALARVAVALRACMRRPSDMAARYGGEEFALVLADTDASGAALVAEAARAAVENLGISRGRTPGDAVLTISGGIAMLSGISQTPSQLIANADRRLYQAKRLGRNRIVDELAEPQVALAG